MTATTTGRTMRVVQTEELGTFDAYALVERPVPEPGPGEVLVRVAACGWGYVDSLLARGGYQVRPPLPFVPGQEVAGVVDRVGPGVETLSVGDRVMASGFGGGLAEYSVRAAVETLRIPDDLSFAQAAVLRLNYLTVLHALSDRARLRAGERLLVFGSAGGVGAAAVQVGRILGAEVVAVGSTERKRAFALENGASATIDTSYDGWRDRLKALLGGRGPDVVFDPVCGPLFEAAFRSLAWRGRHLVVGFAGGPFPSLPVNLPLMKGAALVGVDVRQFMEFEPVLARERLATLLEWAGDGRLSPPVGARFPLTGFRQAMEDAATGEGTGKAVVEFPGVARE